MTNYRFKKEFANNKIVIRTKDLNAVVTKDNLTDSLAEVILSMPGFRHNIELMPGKEAEVLQKKKAEGGVIDLPPSIVSALKEAQKEGEQSNNQPEIKESTSNMLTPSMEKNTKKGKGKK